jgi:hypothetical protein
MNSSVAETRCFKSSTSKGRLSQGERIMWCGSTNRGMIGSAVLVVAVAGLIAWQTPASRAADEAPAGKSAATKAPPGKASAAANNPFAVPDGKPTALLS